MSLEVFEVEEDWSCACISVRKGCVLDIISIAYARFIFIGLRLWWKCLRVYWTYWKHDVFLVTIESNIHGMCQYITKNLKHNRIRTSVATTNTTIAFVKQNLQKPMDLWQSHCKN